MCVMYWLELQEELDTGLEEDNGLELEDNDMKVLCEIESHVGDGSESPETCRRSIARRHTLSKS